MAGHQAVNQKHRSDQWQRDKSHPDARTAKKLRCGRADLSADGRPGVHHQRNQNVHIALERVREGSVAGRDYYLEQIRSDRDMSWDAQQIN